ncbi:hypothetical protein AB0B31_27695 [Catellatospora citrea]|uniref:hypothetical protein n=1 Tax=Catellatospora citrea TaxID=53366 RepID=UPI0033D1AF84
MLTRMYCRIAAVVFFLFTAYPLVVKLAEHRLAHDWAHVVLHLSSMLAAGYAGWLAATDLPARLFTWAVGVGYTLLGTVGWFIDGLLLTTPVAIPLAPVDNVFHLALGSAALAVLARDRRIRATAATSGQPG